MNLNDLQVEPICFVDLDQFEIVHEKDDDKIPKSFSEQSHNESVVPMTFPREITIVLAETDTHFLFELPSMTADADSEEGQAAEVDNENYDRLIEGKGPLRKRATKETQTVERVLKVKYTNTPKIETESDYAFASAWDMYDSFAESGPRTLDIQNDKRQRFRDATVAVERVLANNAFRTQQEQFKEIHDVTKEDPIELIHLWSFHSPDTFGLSVTSTCWNAANTDILAVGYGKYYYTDQTHGMIGIWSVKNPIQTERLYDFQHSVSCLKFSTTTPNFLAVGFYNGDVLVLDIVSYEKKITARTDRSECHIYKPIWQIEWFRTDEGQRDEIITTGEDGRVYRFAFTKTNALCGRVIMTMDKPNKADMPIVARASCVRFSFRPPGTLHYYVGTSQGWVHKCSLNDVNQPEVSFRAHDTRITAVHFSPFNRSLFVTSGADWTVKVWSCNVVPDPLMIFTAERPVECVALSPTHSTLLAAVDEANVYMWDLKNAYDPLVIKTNLAQGTADSLTDLKFSADGGKLIVGDKSGGVRFYSLFSVLSDFDKRPECTLECAVERAVELQPDLANKNIKIF